jgi:methylmalonyl-CoA/ethylmalonyl-CoA epimerase
MNKSLALNLCQVGYAVRMIDPIAANYVRRYGYDLSTRVLHHPLQTAFVQFLKLAGDRTYLELVAPDGPESKLMNAAKRVSSTTFAMQDRLRQLSRNLRRAGCS